MRNFLLPGLLLLVFCSCHTTQQLSMPRQTNDPFYEPGDPVTQSLFNDKSATISEENIQKILGGSFQLPTQLRVAFVRVDNPAPRNYWSNWNDEQYLKTQQAYQDQFTAVLKQSSRVASTSTVPALLLAKPQTFTSIREAAVRMQADVVVAYSITTDIYSKYKLFTRPDIKAFATTQVILLDVRTGLVPFSTIVTKDQLSKKLDMELDNNEATNRIQREAVLLTIDEIGKQLKYFLDKK